MKKIWSHIKGEKVLLIALFAAVVSMIFVPVDAAYAGYVDWDVLMLLFALMAVVAGLKSCGLMDRISDMLIRSAGNARALCMALSMACFFSAMLVTNDVALITFVPLTTALLAAFPKQLILAVTICVSTLMNVLYQFTIIRWIVIVIYAGVVLAVCYRYREMILSLFLKKKRSKT